MGRNRRSDQPIAQRNGNGGGACGNVQLGEDRGHAVLNRFAADEERLCDLRDGGAGTHQFKDVQLSPGQAMGFLPLAPRTRTFPGCQRLRDCLVDR